RPRWWRLPTYASKWPRRSAHLRRSTARADRLRDWLALSSAVPQRADSEERQQRRSGEIVGQRAPGEEERQQRQQRNRLTQLLAPAPLRPEARQQRDNLKHGIERAGRIGQQMSF